MHYIRLLRRITVASTVDESVHFCKVLLTITTDLGDDFHAPSEPLPLSFAVDHAEGRAKVCEADGKVVLWKAGMRALALQLRVPVANLFQGNERPSLFDSGGYGAPLISTRAGDVAHLCHLAACATACKGHGDPDYSRASLLESWTRGKPARTHHSLPLQAPKGPPPEPLVPEPTLASWPRPHF